ncbi:GNAT family N-acetyltransferase [Vibrio neptunius]|uniref:GNAT family N-acetyltransferase n=1 Tax=Vibrio neptunius TaxID=170651 RepID=A0ABS3A551_9VIBR|nr:GNAT family N-acetyltransferase [Vibrio neptunius]MBN3494656.1 GNAT family N-acetyltransferase [Vibrio neptunius]MBN3517074.1 GNAT family N-acetyltransferase [Vibrio neptunius]MBN3551469.1 GNAT family N-acetyltransferase [Vibrio neptunius]MBN3579468.1 GNAT family N-acetyltransferase [Vibrio neptunius]MCH9873132.1 GNAT family N-acetyltransferase [Vibrio neptunius]
MKYKQIAPEYVPLPLLLEADPSEENIQSYLRKSQCFVAEDDEGNSIGVMVVLPHSQSLVELMNASVLPTCHGRGIGSHLLAFALRELKSSGVKRVELGTGCFGYQLKFYQRLGFRVDAILKDHFLTHYSEPIFEDGIQHKDMLRLYLEL